MATTDDSHMSDAASLSDNLHQMLELDRIIHEPARLVILAALNNAEEVDFKFLETVTRLTRGNLSRQASNLEEADYIQIRKYYKGKVPATSYRITPQGRQAFATYWERMAAFQQSFLGRSHHPETEQNKEEES